uniref:Uncharacterized protein n=1 Tax=Tanacetum cinerariifolium TaxID=118510 RepID=A0A699I7S1_TANCI|nr:hypothetical protein [Tanacetum cinerariifolium]
MKEREVKAIKEIEKRIKEKEIQQQESLVTEGTTLKDNLSTYDTIFDATSVIEGSTMEVCLVTEGTVIDACLVTEDAVLDSLVAKESTVDSSILILYTHLKETMIRDIVAIDKYLIEAILHKHEIKKRLELQSNVVQINPVQALEASLVVIESSGTESENNSLKNTFSRLENEHTSSNKESSTSEGND